MSDITLPTEIAAQIALQIKLIDSVPDSEKLNAFRLLSYEITRTLSYHMPRAAAADQLHHYAVLTGIIATYGEDAVQQIMQDAFRAVGSAKEEGEEEDLSRHSHSYFVRFPMTLDLRLFQQNRPITGMVVSFEASSRG